MKDEYTAPVSQLLTLGELDFSAPEEWRNYLSFGLKHEHVPDLIRMVRDEDFNNALGSTKEVWAPMHALRTLGQLHAVEAVGPLLDYLAEHEEDYDDWFFEDFPYAIALIGPSALPALQELLMDDILGIYTRETAALAVCEIAKKHPENRAECVAALERSLQLAEKNPPSLNGFLIAYLIEMDAVEAFPSIKRAYELDAVDYSITGSLEAVEYDLGLRDEPPDDEFGPFKFDPALPGSGGQLSQKDKQKKKAKRKQANASRKKNRKKK